MAEYLFETKEFGLSNNGIHLLRNRFNFKTIEFHDVREISIEKGKELNNWIIILIIGISMLIASIFYSINLWMSFYDVDVPIVYIEQIAAPVLPVMFGFFCIYASLKSGIVLRIVTIDNKKEKFALKEIFKVNLNDELINYLSEKFRNKFENNIK